MPSSWPSRFNVLVVGAGPAGLAVAASCAEAGLQVLLVDPSLDRGLPNLYGMWVDEVELPEECYARRWSRPLVFSDADGARELTREYGHLDNERLARWLRGRFDAAGGWARRTAVVQIDVGASGGRAWTEDGDEVLTDVVIDCTGSARRFLSGSPGSAGVADVAWQTAYGIVADVDQVPWEPDQMVLMDYRSVDGSEGVPSFLYAMPLGGRRVLLEETVLAAVPAVPTEQLAGRLDRRLRALGITVNDVHHIEHVRIPMDQPLPRIPQRVVGYGAAAGFVHPATGYSVDRSLALAPDVAEVVVAGLAHGGPEEAARRAWSVVQPPSRRRAYRLARSGLKALLAFGPDAMGQFMHHFFAMPQSRWGAFLSGTSSASALATSMVHLGGYLPLPLVLKVTHLVACRGAVDFARGLVPGLEGDVRFTS